MSKSYDRAIESSTSQIIKQAWAEYCAKSFERYNELVAIIQAAVTESDILGSPEEATGYSPIVLGKFPEYGYTGDSIVTLNCGVTTLSSLINSIGYSVSRDREAIYNGFSVPEQTTLSLELINGTIVPTTVEDLFTEIANTQHAMTVEVAVATAYCTSDNIADKITTIRDVMASNYNSAYADASNSLDSAISMVRADYDIMDYINVRLKRSGLTDAASSNITYDHSDDVTYTGATFAPALSWSFSWDMYIQNIDYAVKEVSDATVKAVRGLIKGAKKFFRKVKRKVVEATVNPYDIKVVNDNGNNTVDGFYYQTSYAVSQGNASALWQQVQKGPLHMDFLPFEAFAIADVENQRINYLVKVKPINHSLISTLQYDGYRQDNDTYWYSANTVSTLLNNLSMVGDFYTSTDRSEGDLFLDFVAGVVLSQMLIVLLEAESYGRDLTSTTDALYTTKRSMDKLFLIDQNTITNRSFLKLLTEGSYRISSGELTHLTLSSQMLTMLLDNVFSYQESHPFDYPMWPYSQNNANWFEPSFSLATDQDNIQDQINFFVNSIKVAAVATISIIAFVKLKRAATKAKVALMGAEWKLSEAAASGSVPKTLLKEYKTAERKAKLTTLLAGGAIGSQITSSSPMANLFDPVVIIDPITKLIK